MLIILPSRITKTYNQRLCEECRMMHEHKVKKSKMFLCGINGHKLCYAIKSINILYLILNITCATVCSPSGMSSVLNATLWTTLVASASRIILKKDYIIIMFFLLMLIFHFNIYTFLFTLHHKFHPLLT